MVVAPDRRAKPHIAAIGDITLGPALAHKAMAEAQVLFPELSVGETIEAYLNEGIDINADGEYIERSTGVYNAVCNRALRFAARILERPELLEPVRRNLDLSYHLRQIRVSTTHRLSLFRHFNSSFGSFFVDFIGTFSRIS